MQKQIIKKNIYFLLLSIFIVVTIFFYFEKSNVVVSPISQIAQIESVVSVPKKLIIPKIDVDTNIEQVGVAEDGRMGLPETSSNVGWYKFGNTPGTTGNAVIAGHLNNFLGLPLVFWRLDELEIGDDVYVINEKAEQIHFKVTKKELYDYNSFNTEDIFGPTNGNHLNLITCNGVWVKDIKNYDKRLVIFSEAV